MKDTIAMLTWFFTTLFVWFILGTTIYLLSETLCFRDAMKNDVVIFIMMILGWLPGIIIAKDVTEKLFYEHR